MSAESIRVTFPSGKTLDVERGIPAVEAARAGGQPAKKAIAARCDGRLVDLNHPLSADCHLSLVQERDPEAIEIFRHSTSHVMAQAVQELFPETKIAQGPATDDGFYYDFRREQPFTDADLPKIEERMREIVARALPIERHEVPRDRALEIFEGEGEPYKVHFVREKSGPIASYYQQGEFRDFCLGPHLPSTAHIGAFKLLQVAAAYWLGSEKNETLWRIYGTAYPKKKDLDAHLQRLEEAKKRDHRRLGKDLDLFSLHENVGGGLVFWHPKGATVRHELETMLREQLNRRNYVFVLSPHVARDTLFRTSGHYDFYRENMYTLDIDEEEFVIKPMNCPGHTQIYKTGLKSYRDLPVRMAEFGTVYRYERSGTMHGLFRVRGFTQDDAHIFCRPDQLLDEIDDCLGLVQEVFSFFGFEQVRYELSVRDSTDRGKYAGSDEEWEASENALVAALEKRGLAYERYEGEAVFYGPKIDVKVVDAIGRPWQLSTIQFDFNLPERFELSYVDQDGTHKPPYMVHRAIFGSFERFFGILIEHFAGAFPVWLAPVQARILPVSEKVLAYAEEVESRLRKAGLRSELDRRSDKVGAKIRDAELQKIPYMLIVGPREAESGSVSLRIHQRGDEGSLSVEDFIERARTAMATRALEA